VILHAAARSDVSRSARPFRAHGANARVREAPQIAGDTARMTTARELTNRLADLLRKEHGAMADFLLLLADLDRRRLWRDLGHASLFSFLRRELGLSAGAAQYRKTAAEIVQRFPQVEAALRDGRLCLSSVIELGKVLTPENAAEVLPRFFGLSSRDAAQVAVSIRPVEDPPQREVVTPLRAAALALPAAGSAPRVAATVAVETPAQLVRAPEPEAPGVPAAAAPSSSPRVAAPPKSTVEPLAAEASRLHVTVSRRFLEKLEAATAALSHALPGAGMEEILEAGLDLVLAEHARRKGLAAKPRKEPPPSSPESRHVPAHVRRAVWKRDGGRCQWRMEDGTICGSTFQVEFDHVHPWALGGPSTVENTRLACRGHNQLAARRAFGDAWTDRFTSAPRTRRWRPAARWRRCR
jgi:hypothetical protein